MAASLTLTEVEALTPEQIDALSGIKTILSVFTNGKNGRPIPLTDMKAFNKDERDGFAAECKLNFVENCKA